MSLEVERPAAAPHAPNATSLSSQTGAKPIRISRTPRNGTEQPKAKEKLGTNRNQWVWILDERKLALKRDPKFAFSHKAFNGRYFLFDDPSETDPGGVIIRSFSQHADIRTFYPDAPAGIIIHCGKRCLNMSAHRDTLQ